jgi:hypothetical protein
MFRTKKALLMLAAASTLFASGCFSGQWLKWITVTTKLGSDFTNILEHFNIVNGY